MSAEHPLITAHGSCVRGLDRATGRTLWEYKVVFAIGRLALVNDRVYALDDGSHLHCLTAATGAVLGVVTLDRDQPAGCALLVDGDKIYIATARSVFAVDLFGKIEWRADTGQAAKARAGLELPGNIVQPDFTGH
jgi:outer membrane protein assembly factor BamB